MRFKNKTLLKVKDLWSLVGGIEYVATPLWEECEDEIHTPKTRTWESAGLGEGGGFPRVRAVVSLMSPGSLVACPSTKGVTESELTNLLVGLMQIRVSN
jgi:hypothetical protein